jgi:hypothetical protein
MLLLANRCHSSQFGCKRFSQLVRAAFSTNQPENPDDVKKEYRRLYYLKNREAVLEKRRIYYMNNPDLLLERKRLYDEKNRDLIREKRRLYYQKNRDAERERSRQYYQQNKESELQRTRTYYHENKPEPVNKTWATPDDWDDASLSTRGKRAAQRWLFVQMKRLLPDGTPMFEDFKHPVLQWSISLRAVEFDIWIPSMQLALEYQGEQHYHDNYGAYGPNGEAGLYKQRDEEKLNLVSQEGITLVSYPLLVGRKH